MVDFLKTVVKDLHLIVDVRYFLRWKTISLLSKLHRFNLIYKSTRWLQYIFFQLYAFMVIKLQPFTLGPNLKISVIHIKQFHFHNSNSKLLIFRACQMKHPHIYAIMCFPITPITLSSERFNIQWFWAQSNHPIHLSIVELYTWLWLAKFILIVINS
jgi:hypothetical protein